MFCNELVDQLVKDTQWVDELSGQLTCTSLAHQQRRRERFIEIHLFIKNLSVIAIPKRVSVDWTHSSLMWSAVGSLGTILEMSRLNCWVSESCLKPQSLIFRLFHHSLQSSPTNRQCGHDDTDPPQSGPSDPCWSLLWRSRHTLTRSLTQALYCTTANIIYER